MARTIFVGNIDRIVEREQLREFFENLCGELGAHGAPAGPPGWTCLSAGVRCMPACSSTSTLLVSLTEVLDALRFQSITQLA